MSNEASQISPENETDVVEEAKPAVDDAALKRIKELEARVTEYEAKFVEARAFVRKLESEVEAIRTRSERDAQKLVDQRVSDFALKLVPALDLFELSLRSVDAGAKDFDSFVNGIRLIENEMKLAFERLGFERVGEKGDAFDPHCHEAITMQPVSDADQDGRILEVVKVGYSFSGRVIRPAQVLVGQYQESNV